MLLRRGVLVLMFFLEFHPCWPKGGLDQISKGAHFYRKND